jgi:DNA-binding transcriptional LysR family regulator
MNLSQFRAIVAVAEHGNFSEAALSLNVSQSSVSHAIAALEEELGVLLFVRGRHGAVLTPAGKQITAYAQQILHLTQQIQQEANYHKSLQGGQVRLAAFRSVATHVLPTIIAQFYQRFPNIQVTIQECFDRMQVEQLIRTGEVDIGFTYAPTNDEFESWNMMQDEYIVLLPPDAQACADSLTWEALAKLPLILPVRNPFFEDLYQHLAQFAPPLNIAYTIHQGSTMVSLVTQGLGAAILPHLAAKPIPEAVKVCRLPEPLVRVLVMAVRSDALHSPAVFTFLELLKQASLTAE